MSKSRILVVEDDTYYHKLIHRALEDKYDLRFVANLQEAQTFLENREEIELAVIDPGLDPSDNENRDGFIVLKRIVAQDAQVSIIVLTADKQRVSEDPSIREFISGVIEKENFSPKRFAETLNTILRRKQARDHWSRLGQQGPKRTGYESFKHLLVELQGLTAADVAHVLMPSDDGNLEIVADTGQDEGRIIQIKSVTGRAFQTNSEIKLDDARKDPDYVPPENQTEEMNSELTIPIHAGKTVVGVLNLESQSYSAFNERHIELARTFAELAVLMAQEEYRIIQLREFGRELIESVLDLEKVWESILNRGMNLINAEIGYLAVSEQDGNLYVKEATDPDYKGFALAENSTAARVLQSQEPYRGNVLARGSNDSIPDLVSLFERGSILAVPLLRNGGVLAFERKEIDKFNEQDEKQVLLISAYCSVAIRMESQAKELAQLEGLRRQKALAGNFLHTTGTPIFDIRDLVRKIKGDHLEKLKNVDPLLEEIISRLKVRTEELNLIIAQFYEAYYGQLGPSDVNRAMKAAYGSLAEFAEDKELDIILDVNDNLPPARADRFLSHIIRVLLQNAIEHTPPGGQIKLTTEICDEMIRINVVDSGEGMSAEDASHVFDPNFTTKNDSADANPFHGMGLDWARDMVTGAYEGKISVGETHVGVGTTIEVLLHIFDEHKKQYMQEDK